MSKRRSQVPEQRPDALFDRVVAILEEARGRVVRAVNTQMVTAYWLIGREIVEAVQGGEERAEYGKQVLSDLSTRLTERYGKGFSVPNLQNFRKFYLAYAGRFGANFQIQYPTGTKSGGEASIQYPAGRELVATEIRYPSGEESPQGFSPHLSWSHYRALMRVENRAARDFYEQEAAECGWSAFEQATIDNLQFLPSEEELRLEIVKERKLIEGAMEQKEQHDE